MKFCTKWFILAIVLFCSITTIAYPQQKERRIYLWDTTYSLVNPNRIWNDVKESLAEAIENVDVNPQNTIIVVPFNKMGTSNIVWEEKATEEGKAKLVSKVKAYNQPSKNTMTDICSAISKFHSLVKVDCINYMFLFTDGEDENDKGQRKLTSTINTWTSKTSGKQIYGFYIAYDKVSIKKDIEDAIERQTNLWLVRSANINVNMFKLPSEITYNIRNDKSKNVIICGNMSHCGKSKIKISLSENDYYTLSQRNEDVKDGELSFILKKKVQKVPEIVNLTLSLTLCEHPPYSYVVPDSIALKVIDKKENVLKINIRKK